MGARFRAIKVEADDGELFEIAKVIQSLLGQFQNPINFSILVYAIPDSTTSKVIELVAFESKEASHLSQPNEELLSVLKIEDEKPKKKSFISRFMKSKTENTNPQQHIDYICSLAAVIMAHACSKVLGDATAIILSDTLCECGHIIFNNGTANEGVLVSPDSDDAKVCFKNNSIKILPYEALPDYHQYFLPPQNGSIIDAEEFLDSLNYLGRIQLMLKKEIINSESFELQKA